MAKAKKKKKSSAAKKPATGAKINKKTTTKTKTKKEESKFPIWVALIPILVVSLVAVYYLTAPGEPVDPTVPTTTVAPNVGANIISAGKIISINYIGRFENGTLFDTTIEAEAKSGGIYIEGRAYAPFTFVVGTGQVIDGFDEGLIGLRAGEKKTITVPPEKGYTIPEHPMYGKTLIFDVEVLEITDPVTIGLTIVTDKTCGADCDTSRILSITQSLFPGIAVNEVDINSVEGKALVEKYAIVILPTYLFDSSLSASKNFEANAEAFTQIGDKYALKNDVTGATYYASEEARIKAEADAKIAAEAKCENMEKAEKPVFDAFVVSYCPFGVQMQRILVPVIGALGDSADVNIRYIGEIVNDKITAMHGDEEAQENLLQICLREEQADKFLSYLSCFIKEGKTAECLVEAKVDTTELTACMADTARGNKYAQVDFDIQDKYSVSGSPTLIFNGARASEFDFGGRTAEAVKSLICCGFNDKPESCDTALDTRQAATSFSAVYSAEAQTTSAGSC